jgi:hypothetical protein
MENQLKYENIPNGYELCFNNNCQLRECCLHYQAYRLQPEVRLHGPAIYPAAWASGQCQHFRDVKPVQKAWGFSQLYKNVPRHLKAEARECVMNYFSSGCGPYYRYHHGENLLSPRHQEDILNILARYGSTEGLAFDHYVTEFDFS